MNTRLFGAVKSVLGSPQLKLTKPYLSPTPASCMSTLKANLKSQRKNLGNYLSLGMHLFTKVKVIIPIIFWPDGGPKGLNGLPALHVLQEMFMRLERDFKLGAMALSSRYTLEEIALPCNWFDLFIGTGIGA